MNCLIEGSIDEVLAFKFGYYDQTSPAFIITQMVLEELWSAHSRCLKRRSFDSYVSFSQGTDVENNPLNSAGVKRACLASSANCLEHDTLLLDEPTNHSDIDSKEVRRCPYRLRDGTICFVSYDRFFINKVATAISEIEELEARCI